MSASLRLSGLSVGLALLLLMPQTAPPPTPAPTQDVRAAGRTAHDEAMALVQRAAAMPADSAERTPLLGEIADRLDRLADTLASMPSTTAPSATKPSTTRPSATTPSATTPSTTAPSATASSATAPPPATSGATPLPQALRDAAKALRTRVAGARAPFDAAPLLALLQRVDAVLGSNSLTNLAFQGSYSQTKVAEPVYGGHATAMGPPPEEPRAPRDAAGLSTRESPAQFEEAASLATKSFCGSRAKTHILESGGSGVALFDYDGDGWLDVYVLSAFELSDDRQPIPHRNALFRNKGGWKFEDVSAGSGLDVAAWSNGVCAGDYDGDGRLDLYVTTFGSNFLFHNNGDGTFTDKAAAAGVQAQDWSTGCTFFDADGDGDLDLYVARYVSTTWNELQRLVQPTLVWRGGPKTMVGPVGLPGESDLFFENQGDGTFKEATDAHGLTDAARAYGFGVVATDYDDDGWVDLYVANDTNPNFLYHNRGDGRFESVGLASGAALNAEGRAQAGMGVDSGDYDGDGRLDLIVTNFAQDTNTLRRNLDGHTFEDVTTATGLAAPTFVRMGWGTAFFDADLDGALDLFFANGHIYPNVDQFPALGETFKQKNQLFINSGTVAADALKGATALKVPPHPLPPLPRERGKSNEPGTTTASRPSPRAPQLNSQAPPQVNPQAGPLANPQDAAANPQAESRQRAVDAQAVRFVDVSETAGRGLQIAESSRGLAVGDLDNDGDLDLVISNMDAAPTLLNNTQRTGHHWVAVRVEGEASSKNRFAIGARVTIDAGGARQVREIRSGGSYLSQNDLRAFYGLGAYSGLIDIDVRMPGGRTWRWRGQPGDRLLTLRLDDAHGAAAAPARR